MEYFRNDDKVAEYFWVYFVLETSAQTHLRIMNNKRKINIAILECNPIALVTRRHFACNLIQLVFL